MRSFFVPSASYLAAYSYLHEKKKPPQLFLLCVWCNPSPNSPLCLFLNTLSVHSEKWIHIQFHLSVTQADITYKSITFNWDVQKTRTQSTNLQSSVWRPEWLIRWGWWPFLWWQLCQRAAPVWAAPWAQLVHHPSHPAWNQAGSTPSVSPLQAERWPCLSSAQRGSASGNWSPPTAKSTMHLVEQLTSSPSNLPPYWLKVLVHHSLNGDDIWGLYIFGLWQTQSQ